MAVNGRLQYDYVHVGLSLSHYQVENYQHATVTKDDVQQEMSIPSSEN
jgi:hypothetical protein